MRDSVEENGLRGCPFHNPIVTRNDANCTKRTSIIGSPISAFDPNRKSRPQFCCAARRPSSGNGMEIEAARRISAIKPVELASIKAHDQADMASGPFRPPPT